MTLLHDDVRLPQGARSRGGILATALPLPDGWEEGGVSFYGAGCAEPVVTEACDVMDGTTARPGGPDIFEPIWIRQSAQCSMLSKIGSEDLAAQRLESTTEWAMGRLLQVGAGALPNPVLSGGDEIAVGAGPEDIVALVGCLEQAAADVGFGAEIMLHAPPLAAAYLKEANLIDELGLSPSGHQWVISSGYSIVGGELQLYATGRIFAAVTEAYNLNDSATGRPPVGWRTNDDEPYRQRLGLAAFDSCLNLRATMPAPICSGGS